MPTRTPRLRDAWSLTKLQREQLARLTECRVTLQAAQTRAEYEVALARSYGVSEQEIAHALEVHRGTLRYRYGSRQEKPGRPAKDQVAGVLVPMPRDPS